MSKALNYLCELLAEGWEWPDASAKAAVKFKVNIDELTAEYDRQMEQK